MDIHLSNEAVKRVLQVVGVLPPAISVELVR